MAHSPHRRRKGCGLCKPHKIRGLGAERIPWSARRALGRKRRLDKGDE